MFIHIVFASVIHVLIIFCVWRYGEITVRWLIKEQPWFYLIPVWRDQLIALIILDLLSEFAFALTWGLVGKLLVGIMYASAIALIALQLDKWSTTFKKHRRVLFPISGFIVLSCLITPFF